MSDGPALHVDITLIQRRQLTPFISLVLRAVSTAGIDPSLPPQDIAKSDLEEADRVPR